MILTLGSLSFSNYRTNKIMKRCVVCKTLEKKDSGVTFHKFPSDERLKLWLKNMKLSNHKPAHFICSQHFTKDSFDTCFARTRLKKTSVPTIIVDQDPTVTPRTNSSLEVKQHYDDYLHSQQGCGLFLEPFRSTSLPQHGGQFSEMEPLEESNVPVKTEPDDDCQIEEQDSKRDESYYMDFIIPRIKAKLPQQADRLCEKDPLDGASPLYEDEAAPIPSESVKKVQILVKRNPTSAVVQQNTSYISASSTGNRMKYALSKRPKTLAELCPSVNHDHIYEASTEATRQTLKRVQTYLKISQERVKALTRKVKRLKNSIGRLKRVNMELKTKCACNGVSKTVRSQRAPS